MRRELASPTEAHLALAVMWQPERLPRPLMPEPLPEVEKEFGRIISRSPVFDFSFTEYYSREMGQGLKKCFVEIEGSFPREKLPDFKSRCVEFETRYMSPEGRVVNVDPMLITLENVVIASSKNFPHRVYLGQGVYGDLGLIRRKSGYESLPWSYPDYLENKMFFEDIHRRLRQKNPAI